MTDPTTALVQVGPTIIDMKGHFADLQSLKTEILKARVDYGTIPGCGDKPTLLKPGAEKVLKRFMVHVADIMVEDLSTSDERRYRVKCIGKTPDGVIRGVGIGECSTDEDKFRWKRTNPNEFERTQDARKRIKYYADYEQPQVRTNPADLANTALKIAKKRALVDLALTACAASEFFTQDLEELPREDVTTKAPIAAKQPATPPPSRTDKATAAKSQVWMVAKELGLTGEDVRAVISLGNFPLDAALWTTKDVGLICDALRVRAEAGTFEQPVEEPPPGPRPGNHHHEAAHKEALALGASEEQWATACEVALVGEVPGLAWNESHTDLVIGELEKILGM